MKKLINGFGFLCALLLFSCATGGGDKPAVEAVSPEEAAGLLSLDEAVERSAAELAAELPSGTRVAVAAFSSEHENLSAYIMDELAGALADGSLEVADRRNLAFVYRELGFQMSGDVSDESAAEIGKFLGAPYVITGQLVKAGNRYRYRLAGINVEKAVQESSSRLNVRDDLAFRSLLADVRSAPLVTTAAAYDAGPAPQTGAAPKTAGAFLDRGILFAMRGDFESAVADFTEAIRLDGALATAYVLRGRALYASVINVTGLGEGFGSVGFNSSGGNPTDEQKTVYARAVTDFTQAIRADPDNKTAYRERGLMYRQQGDYDRAIADFNQAIRLDPNYAAAYINRGIGYENKGDYDRAIADYDQVIRLNPNNAAAYTNRGNAYANKRGYDRAIADYDQAIRLSPNNAAAYSNRGLAYYRKGDNDRAIADYDQALRLDPNYAAAYYNRSNAYYSKGDYDRAIEDYTQAIRLNPNYAAAYYNRGIVYRAKGDNDRAIEDYTQAIRLDPNNAAAYTNRGNAYYSKGGYDRAIEDHTQALRLNPNNAAAYTNRGAAYYTKGDYDRAIADYEAALRINPNHVNARNNLEIARRARGR